MFLLHEAVLAELHFATCQHIPLGSMQLCFNTILACDLANGVVAGLCHMRVCWQSCRGLLDSRSVRGMYVTA